jgi:hypothetical protein
MKYLERSISSVNTSENKREGVLPYTFQIRSNFLRRYSVCLPVAVAVVCLLIMPDSATAFYGITPILLPCNLPVEVLIQILQKTKPDFLIAAAGGLSLTEVVRFYGGLKQVIWVVEEGSRHMDWNEVPEGIGGQAGVGVWHEIVEEKRANVGSAVPDNAEGDTLKNLVSIWQGEKNSVGEVVEFTQKVRYPDC